MRRGFSDYLRLFSYMLFSGTPRPAPVPNHRHQWSPRARAHPEKNTRYFPWNRPMVASHLGRFNAAGKSPQKLRRISLQIRRLQPASNDRQWLPTFNAAGRWF
jgi:hypothetical protein